MAELQNEVATDKFYEELNKATKQKDWPFTVDDKVREPLS